MNNTMAYAVEADDLVKTDPGGVTALDGLSISALSTPCRRGSGPWRRSTPSTGRWTVPAVRPRPTPDRTAVAVHGGWS
jgi:hypothetical protein